MHPIVSELYVQDLISERHRKAATHRSVGAAHQPMAWSARVGRVLVRVGERMERGTAFRAAPRGA